MGTYQRRLCSSWTTISGLRDLCNLSLACLQSHSNIHLPGYSRRQAVMGNITAVYPMRHCWVSRTENTSTSYYALFGYDSTTNFTSSEIIYNITGGYEVTEPITTFRSGKHPFTFAIISSSDVVTLSFVDQFSPSVNGSSPQYFPNFQSISMNMSNPDLQCPNRTLNFTVGYPSSNSSNLISHLRQLYSTRIPYPIELVTVAFTVSNDTDSDNEAVLSRRQAPPSGNNYTISMYPGADVEHPYYSYALGIGANEVPSDGVTGPAAAIGAVVISPIPVRGGLPTPEDLPPPPGLNAFAKGAIAICIIVGVIIVAVSILILCLSKTNSLPTTSRREQNKLIRKRRRRRADVEQGDMRVPLSGAEASGETSPRNGGPPAAVIVPAGSNMHVAPPIPPKKIPARGKESASATGNKSSSSETSADKISSTSSSAQPTR